MQDVLATGSKNMPEYRGLLCPTFVKEISTALQDRSQMKHNALTEHIYIQYILLNFLFKIPSKF